MLAHFYENCIFGKCLMSLFVFCSTLKYKQVFKKSNDKIRIFIGVSVNSEEINYKNMFLERTERRKQQEKIANAAQQKQVDGVNKIRTLGDGKVLPWGSFVVFKDAKGLK
jgi:hypothetical protein